MRSSATASECGGACQRCVSHPPAFDVARAVGLYEGALRQIIHALKYHRHQSLGPPLGAMMKATNHGLLACADAVVPVPLHPWRRMRRGFNQAEALARELGRPVWQPLRRRSLGVAQARLSGDERRANVLEAYRLSISARRLRRRRPKYVVLIDDVMTTGATLDGCSRALREAGVEWIGALTLARATSNAESAGAGPPLPPQPAPRPSKPRRQSAPSRAAGPVAGSSP